MAGNVTFDGGSIDGFIREEELDMVLRPDPATFAVLPWTSTASRSAYAVRHRDARRHAVRRLPAQHAQARDRRRRRRAARVKTALEVEFYLFELDPDGTPSTRTVDAGSYFDFSPCDRGDDARTAMSAALEAMGIRVLERASRTRRGSARTRSRGGRRARHGRPAGHRAQHGQTIASGTAFTRRSCRSRSKRRPAADCTSTSRWATSTKSCGCTRSPAARSRAGLHRRVQPDGQLVQAPGRRVGRAGLHGLVAAQRERARARSAADRRGRRCSKFAAPTRPAIRISRWR